MATGVFGIQQFWLHPDGIHIGHLIGTEVKAGKYGPMIIWTWETEVPTEGNRLPRLDHRTGTDFGEKTSLSNFFRQMGWKLPENDAQAKSLDPDRFIGQRARLTIVHELQTDGSKWANIKGFAPATAGPTPAAEAPPVAAAPPTGNGTGLVPSSAGAVSGAFDTGAPSQASAPEAQPALVAAQPTEYDPFDKE